MVGASRFTLEVCLFSVIKVSSISIISHKVQLVPGAGELLLPLVSNLVFGVHRQDFKVAGGFLVYELYDFTSTFYVFKS